MTQRIEVDLIGNDKSLGSTLDRSQGQVGKFSGAVGGLAKGAALGLGGAALAVGGFVAKSVKDLATVERINAQTGSVIKSTGGAANVSEKQVAGLAGALERTTATEAEAVQEGQNLLLTFTNVKNEAGKGNQIFDRTTRAMVDMSRAMGTDTKGSAIQLGKALNDPVKGVGALSRVGVSFTAQQKSTIKSLVDTGNTMGAQKLILGELEKQFGGSAEAYAKTTEGKIELAKHAIGDLGETVSAGMLPLVGKAASGISTVLNKVTDSYPQIAAKVRAGVEPVLPIVGKIGGFIGGLVERGRAALPVFAQFAGAIGQRLGPVVGQLVTTFQTRVLPTLQRVAPTVGRIVVSVGKFVGGAILLGATILGKVLPPLIRFGGFIFSKVVPALVGVVGGVVKVVGAMVRFGVGIGQGVAAVVRFGLKVSEKIRDVVGFFTGLPGRIKGAVGNLGGLLVNAGKSILDGLLSGITSRISAVKDKLMSVTKLIPDWKGPKDKDKRLLTPAGRFIIGGLVKGLASQVPGVRKLLGRLTGDIETFGGKAKPKIGLDVDGKRPRRRLTAEERQERDERRERRQRRQERRRRLGLETPQEKEEREEREERRRQRRRRLRRGSVTATSSSDDVDLTGYTGGRPPAGTRANPFVFKIKLSGEETTRVQRGREITLDVEAYRRVGGGRTGSAVRTGGGRS